MSSEEGSKAPPSYDAGPPPAYSGGPAYGGGPAYSGGPQVLALAPAAPVYAKNCSIGLGITSLVFGVLYIALGIAELAIGKFATAGAILFAPFLLLPAGAAAIYAGKRTSQRSVTISMILNTLGSALTGLAVVMLIARIIVEIIAIPLANSEGPDYYYYNYEWQFGEEEWNETSHPPPTRVPTKYHSMHQPDLTVVGSLFAVEIILMIAACVIVIITAACGCRATCCKPRPTMIAAQGGQPGEIRALVV